MGESRHGLVSVPVPVRDFAVNVGAGLARGLNLARGVEGQGARVEDTHGRDVIDVAPKEENL